MRKPGTSARAVAILAGAGVAAFAISTAAVSSATTNQTLTAAAVKFPFAKFSFVGSVSTSRPSKPSTFALMFKTSFTLAAGSPGISNPASGTLDNVTITEQVGYPVPGVAFVGPVGLPFRSETLALTIAIKGTCFIVQPNGSFVFRGSLAKCVTSSLKLGSKTYKLSKLLTSVGGAFTPTPGAPMWTGSLRAAFRSPGYTFPVATLGAGGFTSLTIGDNGGKLRTRSIAFSG